MNSSEQQTHLGFGRMAATNQSASALFASTPGASMSTLDIDDMVNVPLEELLQSDWFSQNISQMFNISLDNLTNLIMTSQQSANQRDAISLLSTVTIFYALIFIAGILGNLITCIVISRNKFMHTATNFYLFNLAVSDLILLLSGMPQDLYNIWYPMSYPFTDIPCIIESVLSETAANATVLTITAFTVERYIAICHPFRQHTMSKLSRAIKFILAIWMTAFILALPQAMQFSVVNQNGGKLCSMNNDFVVHVFAVSGFIFFGGPMTAICVLYVLIGVKLKRSRLLQAIPRRCYDVNRGISAQSRVIRMLIAVAVAFFLCWAPFHAQRLMAVYGSTAGVTSPLFEKVFRVLDYTSGVLYFLSTCINPLLYNIMSHKFRDAFKITLARHFGLTDKYQTTNHYYSALLRKKGSMRFNTTDSVRTTMTNGSGATGSIGGGSCYRAHRCISASSQSTLMTSLSGKNDVYSTSTNSYPMTNSTTMNNRGSQHGGGMQTQISQMSSLDDANSLLESETHCHSYPHHQLSDSYRLRDFRTPGSSATARTSKLPNGMSFDSVEWQDNNVEPNTRCSDNETEIFTNAVVEASSTTPLGLVVQSIPRNSITELISNPMIRRHKLSRITRRDHSSSFAMKTSPRVELMRYHLPGVALSQIQARHITAGAVGKVRKPSNNRRTGKTLESLSEKFRSRAKRKVPFLRGTGSTTPVHSNSGSSNKESSSSSTTTTSSELPPTAAAAALMRMVHQPMDQEITTNGSFSSKSKAPAS